MGNALTASFNLDLAPLKRDFSQAEQIAKTGAAKVQGAIASANKNGMLSGQRSFVDYGALARQRAVAAGFSDSRGRTARDFLPAPRGKYPTPLDDTEGGMSSRRMRGLGAGLTAIAGVHQLAAVFTQANQEAGELNAKVAKLTQLTGTGAFRGVGEMESNLKEVIGTLDEIQTRTARERQGGERTPWMTLGHIVRRARQGLTGDSDEQEEATKTRLRKQAVNDIQAIAGKQEALNEAERESTTGSERKGAILKAEIEHRERLGQLAAAESAAGVNNPAARNAENKRSQQEVQALGKKFDLKKREEEVENSILNLHSSSLTKEQQSLVALRARINLLKERLAAPGSDEQKTALGTQIHGLENQELGGQYAEYKKPWAQKAEEMNTQQDYRSFVARQTPSGPNAYLSSPDAYNRRDILGNKIDQAGNVIGAAPKTPESGPTKDSGGITKEDISDLKAAINSPDWVTK